MSFMLGVFKTLGIVQSSWRSRKRFGGNMATSESYDKGPRETHPRSRRWSSSIFYNPNLWLLKHGVLHRQSRSPPGETGSNLLWMSLFPSFTSTTLRGPILISFPRVKCKTNGDELETSKCGTHPGSQHLEAQTQA